MKSKFNRFAEINAIKKNDDGTIVVSGFASSCATDSDDEVITPEAMAAAIPDYMKFGAVREMHGKSAAGTALEIAVEDDGRTSFSAHIVDPIAVKKVETGVYKGFSIGGTIKSRDTVNKSTITGLNLIEVSLVDRPANPEALITMFKAEEPKSEKLAKGMSHVAELAWMLKQIGWLTDDQISEMQREGDGSGVPARLLAWMKDGVAILVDMTSEEASELVAQAGAGLLVEPDIDTIEFAAGSKLMKVGTKFSAATVAALADIHAAVKTAHNGLKGLGYDLNADGDENDDDNTAVTTTTPPPEPNDSQKAASIANHDANALAKSEAISKAEELQKSLDAANEKLAKAAKEIEELKAQPVPPKAAILAGHVDVSKAQDNGQQIEKAVNPFPMGTLEHAEWITKSILTGTYQK